MSLGSLQVLKLSTERLLLIPFTTKLCENILANNYSDLDKLNLVRGTDWPDRVVMDTLPRIMNNLAKVDYPTGFESWMIIKQSTREVIGDIGFKGLNFVEKSCDIGYGLVAAERKKGYALEAAVGLINWAFSNELLEEITASCFITNTNSIKLLKKLNFKELSRDSTFIHWSLLKETDQKDKQ